MFKSWIVFIQVAIYGMIGAVLWGNFSLANGKESCEIEVVKIYQNRLDSAVKSTLVTPILGSVIMVMAGGGDKLEATAGW